MASAEARNRWLRGCIVQEDYKGASRPPSSSKPRSEGSPGDGADPRWWLHQQPKDGTSYFWDPSWETCEKEEYSKIQDLKAVIGDNLKKSRMLGDVWSEEEHSEKPEKLFSEMESDWIRIKKTEPWWRTADLNDLASFVSHKSLEHFDNCDLPRPDRWSVPDKGLASLGMGGCEPLSNTASENLHVVSSELSTAQLLEALCHSQTRAREAEKAAQQAYNEKEHMITHFLRQASQLFAYKQWLHVLQLETLCLQHKYQPCCPPTKAKQQKRVQKIKAAQPSYIAGKSFGSFLLGLTLASAGLLLGWTLGWLFR